MNEVEMEHRITAVEKLAKGNERRIGDLESDNKALLELSTSVAVMAEQMKTMSSKVDSMDTAVKRLQSVPASRWEEPVARLPSSYHLIEAEHDVPAVKCRNRQKVHHPEHNRKQRKNIQEPVPVPRRQEHGQHKHERQQLFHGSLSDHVIL